MQESTGETPRDPIKCMEDQKALLTWFKDHLDQVVSLEKLVNQIQDNVKQVQARAKSDDEKHTTAIKDLAGIVHNKNSEVLAALKRQDQDHLNFRKELMPVMAAATPLLKKWASVKNRIFQAGVLSILYVIIHFLKPELTWSVFFKGVGEILKFFVGGA